MPCAKHGCKVVMSLRVRRITRVDEDVMGALSRLRKRSTKEDGGRMSKEWLCSRSSCRRTGDWAGDFCIGEVGRDIELRCPRRIIVLLSFKLPSPCGLVGEPFFIGVSCSA